MDIEDQEKTYVGFLSIATKFSVFIIVVMLLLAAFVA